MISLSGHGVRLFYITTRQGIGDSVGPNGRWENVHKVVR